MGKKKTGKKIIKGKQERESERKTGENGKRKTGKKMGKGKRERKWENGNKENG